MNERTEIDMNHPHKGEMRDLSIGAFRFIAILIAAAGVLMLAGVL
jgi:hypothetical protein